MSLLGDSRHAMLPLLGQGANMAIEDGCLLARCILKFPHHPVEALKRYEFGRRERTTGVVQRSAAMAATFHNDALANPKEGADYYDTIYFKTL